MKAQTIIKATVSALLSVELLSQEAPMLFFQEQVTQLAGPEFTRMALDTGAVSEKANQFVITDAFAEPVPEKVLGKIDYSQHGANWGSPCVGLYEEQSPINLSWDAAEANDYIQFDLLYEHRMSNATVTVDAAGSLIRVDYPNEQVNDIRVFSERSEDQIYHLSHMHWKVPSEHTVDNRQFAAELQIFHVQFATNRQVALSILFDQELSIGSEAKKLKTCFFDSFEFPQAKTAQDSGTNPSIIDIPLKEFIDYLPQDKFAYYYGSETEPDCGEMVTWIVNLRPYVITEDEVSQLSSLLDEATRAAGNFRDIQQLNERTIYKFSNVGNLTGASAMTMLGSVVLAALTLLLI